MRLAAEIVIVCMLEESMGVIWWERCGLETLTTCITSGVEFSMATRPPPTSLCCSDSICITYCQLWMNWQSAAGLWHQHAASPSTCLQQINLETKMVKIRTFNRQRYLCRLISKIHYIHSIPALATLLCDISHQNC